MFVSQKDSDLFLFIRIIELELITPLTVVFRLQDLPLPVRHQDSTVNEPGKFPYNLIRFNFLKCECHSVAKNIHL